MQDQFFFESADGQRLHLIIDEDEVSLFNGSKWVHGLTVRGAFLLKAEAGLYTIAELSTPRAVREFNRAAAKNGVATPVKPAPTAHQLKERQLKRVVLREWLDLRVCGRGY